MVRNVGGIDRGVRIAAGLALVAWALFGSGDYHQWGWLGVVPLFTGLVGWCPPYSLLGINTCPAKRA